MRGLLSSQVVRVGVCQQDEILRIPRRGACLGALMAADESTTAMGFALFDPSLCTTTVDPGPLKRTGLACTGWLLGSGEGCWAWEQARRTSCVIFASFRRAKRRAVPPCRRTAGEEGCVQIELRVGCMQMVLRAGLGWAGWNLDLGSVAGHESRLLPIQRAGHGKVEMKRPSGSNICAALRCNALRSVLVVSRQLRWHLQRRVQTADCGLQPSTARRQSRGFLRRRCLMNDCRQCEFISP